MNGQRKYVGKIHPFSNLIINVDDYLVYRSDRLSIKHSLNKRLGGPGNGIGCSGKERIPELPGIEPRLSSLHQLFHSLRVPIFLSFI
jgi:hypothetical protein